MRCWRTADEAGTEAVGEALAAELAPDGVLLLSGDLGSGKTVLARGIARGLGIDPREIQSPTYTLIREHGSPRRLVHVDLYRLEPGDLDDLGLDELLAGPGVKVIEWAERLPEEMRPGIGTMGAKGALSLDLHRLADGGREIRERPDTSL
ncbi:MAG TPA: tRNA (adenosine(37)-N6)-threonylcarbamoyltransferase complex ATPase subunit type 1 TsaE [Thermoanaerobaculia bacterium]